MKSLLKITIFYDDLFSPYHLSLVPPFLPFNRSRSIVFLLLSQEVEIANNLKKKKNECAYNIYKFPAHIPIRKR